MARNNPLEGSPAQDDADGAPLDPDVRVHRALADPTRTRLLRILRSVPGSLDAHTLAERLGLHLTTVRAHLDVLIDVGLVHATVERRSTPGRPRKLYRAEPDRQAINADGYRLLAEMLTSHIAGTSADAAAEAEAAGRAWGAYLVERPPPYTTVSAAQAQHRMVELLHRLGFQPETDGDAHRISLRHCPFGDIARRHPEVVCALHLGLLRGALQTLDAPLDAQHLEPFVEPGRCIAYLASATDDRRSA